MLKNVTYDAQVRQLNERPRETLELETPAECFMHVLHRPVETAANS